VCIKLYIAIITKQVNLSLLPTREKNSNMRIKNTIKNYHTVTKRPLISN